MSGKPKKKKRDIRNSNVKSDSNIGGTYSRVKLKEMAAASKSSNEQLLSFVRTRRFDKAQALLKIIGQDDVVTSKTINAKVQLLILKGQLDEAFNELQNGFTQSDFKPDRNSFEWLIVSYLSQWRPKRPVGEIVYLENAFETNSETRNSEQLPFDYSKNEILFQNILANDSASNNSSSISKNHIDSSQQQPQQQQPQHQHLTVEELELLAIKQTVKIFELMISFGISPSVTIFDVFMRSHFRRGDFGRVLQLFETMKKEKITPDRRIYTIVIETLAIGYKDIQAAEKIINEMITVAGFELDIYICTVLMNAYLQINDFESSKYMFSKIASSPNMSLSLLTYGTLVNTLCRAGDVSEAHQIVKYEIPRIFKCSGNLVMYNTLINGYGLKGDITGATQVFLDMQRIGIHPAITTFNTLIGAHIKHGDYRGAKQWFDSAIHSGHKPTLVTYNSMINMYLKSNDVDAAQAMYKQLLDARLVPDNATLTPMVEYFSHVGDWEAVVRVIETSRAVAAIEGAGFSGKGRGRVRYAEIAPHNVVIEQMRRNGNFAGVLRRFLEITNAGSGTAAAATSAAGASGAGGDSDGDGGNFQQRPEQPGNISPDVRTYDILIRALGSMKDLDGARYWFDDAMQRNVVDGRVFNTMMSVYLNCNLPHEVKLIYEMMGEKNLEPDPISVTLLFKATEGYSNRTK
ncbi:hypothetical protein HK100_003671 [Physocladia obscura]|uniref:Pentatricopeptide repeat-containing protein n=1 Tax=Physocladia obscura TaxID=109957 RepID=A0AAD5XAC0_9FUNG|nr:hypothetical protein HK100_003671 [Physocladia obscura]